MEKERCASERNGVAVWKLEKVGALLLAAGVAHTKRLAGIGVGTPFVSYKHGGVNAVVDEVDERDKKLGGVSN